MPETKAAIYCHTSYRAGAALAAQEDRCRRLALRLGADEIVTITDAGPCPRARERQGIARLLRLVHSGEVGLVIVDEPPRLSRRLAELRELSRELSRAGARLLFVS